MSRPQLFIIAVVLYSIISWKCDKGIAPNVIVGPSFKPYGLSGVIYFKNWPPIDSIVDLRLVAFLNYPSGNIINEVLQGRAQYTVETLRPYHADSIAYTLLLSTIKPGMVRYIGVGQQYGQNIQSDWRIVGFYHSASDTLHPDSLYIPEDSIVTGINLHVDFNHLPPQP